MIEIREVVGNKKQFLSLLLLADEQEDMIDRYIADGTMYVLDDNGVKGECVVLNVGNNTLEIKNIAIHPDYQRKGYGQAFIDFIIEKYKGEYFVLQIVIAYEHNDFNYKVRLVEDNGIPIQNKIVNFKLNKSC